MPSSRTDIADALARLAAAYPSLVDLPATLAGTVTSQLSFLTAPAGAALFRQRDTWAGFPLVLRGRVRIARPLADGRELVLYDVERGETCVLSNCCLLGHAAYSAHAACETDVDLALLPQPLFDRLLAEPAPFRIAVLNLFGERLVRRVELVEAVGFQRIEQRLAGALLGRGREVRMSHERLAQRLGASRETVSRSLKVFEAHGWVRLHRGAIEILQPQALRAAAGGQVASVTAVTD